MTGHPSTFKGTPEELGLPDWDDHAAIHRVNDGDGLLHSTKAIRRGTFAEMIRHLATLPEEVRKQYSIEKFGDRHYTSVEAMALSRRDDFPSS